MANTNYRSIALVDLSCIWKKNFLAAPGAEPNAATLQTLTDLARVRERVEHVILCLDTPPYSRREQFPEYKAQRPESEAHEVHQKAYLKQRCRELGYQMARVRGAEGDDVIATLAKVYGQWCPEVLLVGADKDLAQCVTHNVRQFCPAIGQRAAEVRGPEEIQQKYGVKPSQMPLWQAIVGDKADNVPGVPGLGQVKSATLLAEYPFLDALKEAVIRRPATMPPKVWQALSDNWEQLERSLALVTLVTDLSLPTEDLLQKLEPLVPETMGSSGDAFELERNETPMPQPIIGKDPNADAFLKDFGARHQEEEQREEAWRKQKREQLYAEASPVGQKMLDIAARGQVAQTRDTQPSPANDQQPKSAPQPKVTEAEFDPIGKSPGANGPLPPKPQAEPAKEAKPAAIVKAPADYGMVTADLQPQDLKSAEVISKWLFASNLYPQFVSAPAIFAVIMRGKELGLGVTTALAGFHVVEGKPTASADLIRSLAMRSPKCKYFRLIHSDDTYAEWETLHADHPEPTRYKYTIEEARRAGLTRGPWEKRPRDMCTKTAAAKLARLVYPGEVLGLYEASEFEEAA